MAKQHCLSKAKFIQQFFTASTIDLIISAE